MNNLKATSKQNLKKINSALKDVSYEWSNSTAGIIVFFRLKGHEEESTKTWNTFRVDDIEDTYDGSHGCSAEEYVRKYIDRIARYYAKLKKDNNWA